MKEKADIGLIGLAVMGQNLVLNMDGQGGFNLNVFQNSNTVNIESIGGGNVIDDGGRLGLGVVDTQAVVVVRSRFVIHTEG